MASPAMAAVASSSTFKVPVSSPTPSMLPPPTASTAQGFHPGLLTQYQGHEPPPGGSNPGVGVALGPRFDARSGDVFYQFCNIILRYENYPDAFDASVGNNARSGNSVGGHRPVKVRGTLKSVSREDSRRRRHSSSPLGSAGSSNESLRLGRSDDDDDAATVSASVANDKDAITCYCNRPYAGRPMVECDNCLTWIHITCTSLKRTDRVPSVWYCYKCENVSPQSSSSNSSPEQAPSSAGKLKKRRRPQAGGSARRKSAAARRKRNAPPVTKSDLVVAATPITASYDLLSIEASAAKAVRVS